ncbi:heme-binding protein [Mycolicibacterium austroafricanum]|uniref:heme-binding protein n=1 Tax=Mycolicibacterium austroafricanum TaxID=39687 RepID=UPI001CA327B9|nr:heme-binding protein [Mycolicibacterium austroafricanum]QZT62275.1 heme-binding protein [Mycolicibacterium austroafricanum]
MNASLTTVRRGLFGMFAGGLLAFGAAAIVAPVANSQPAPDCSASNVAATVSSVAASEGAYLAANPQTNQALSAIGTQPEPESQAAYGAFFAQNPQVEDQLEAIHQPVSALQNQCGIEVTPTPISAALTDA